jgi:hypothetical protein
VLINLHHCHFYFITTERDNSIITCFIILLTLLEKYSIVAFSSCSSTLIFNVLNAMRIICRLWRIKKFKKNKNTEIWTLWVIPPRILAKPVKFISSLQYVQNQNIGVVFVGCIYDFSKLPDTDRNQNLYQFFIFFFCY